MRCLYLSLFLSFVTMPSCKKESEDTSSNLAEIVHSEDGFFVVRLDASREQVVELGTLSESLQGHSLLFSEGSLSDSSDLAFRLKDFNLVHENLQESFELEEFSADPQAPLLSMQPVGVLEKTYAGDTSIPQIQPGKVHWVIPEEKLSQLSGVFMVSLRTFEDDARLFLTAPSPSINGGSNHVPIGGFGLFQLATAPALPDSLLKADNFQLSSEQGAGAWWGHKIDAWQLKSDADSLSVNSLTLRFDRAGDLSFYRIDESEFLTGLSFGLSATKEPGIFDSSNAQILSPWIFQTNFQYGVIFDIAIPRRSVELSILQRAPHISEQSKAIESSEFISVISGRYFGRGVRYDSDGKQSVISERDDLLLKQEDGKLQIKGRIGGFSNQTLLLNVSSAESAKGRVYFASANVGFGRDDPKDLIQLFFTDDRQAFAYVICADDASEFCSSNDSSIDFNFSAFRLGFLQKETEISPEMNLTTR